MSDMRRSEPWCPVVEKGIEDTATNARRLQRASTFDLGHARVSICPRDIVTKV